MSPQASRITFFPEYVCIDYSPHIADSPRNADGAIGSALVSPIGKGGVVVPFSKALLTLLKFHSITKWVHGDARAANFILVDDSVVIIDLAHSFNSQDPSDRQLDVAICIFSYLRLKFDPNEEKNWSTLLNAKSTALVEAVLKLYPCSGSTDTGTTAEITRLVGNLLEGSA